MATSLRALSGSDRGDLLVAWAFDLGLVLALCARWTLRPRTVVANNLIHDTAYFGMGVAGSQNPEEPFARNNVIERNHTISTTP